LPDIFAMTAGFLSLGFSIIFADYFELLSLTARLAAS
jgi:hypothetical protein